MKLILSAPEPINSSHYLADFICGEVSLDEWLKRRALANHLSGASRTFVTTETTGRVMGYYSLAAGAVTHQLATGAIRRNMPDPIPVLVLGRLAVAQEAQGMKVGASLLQDAFLRANTVAENAGIRALLVHALNDKAKQFYLQYGFQESPIHALTLMMRLAPRS